MNINMTRFSWLKKPCILVLWIKVASALEGLTATLTTLHIGSLQFIIHFSESESQCLRWLVGLICRHPVSGGAKVDPQQAS